MLQWRVGRSAGLLNGCERGQQAVELGRIRVADGGQAEVAGGGGAQGEAGAGGGGRLGAERAALGDEDGDLVFAYGEEQKRCRMVSEIGEVRSLQGRAGRKSGR